MPVCFCDPLHKSCSTATCKQANPDTGDPPKTTLGELSRTDCKTCDLIHEGLNLPQIKPIWLQPGWVGEPYESQLQLTWASNTNTLRTKGSGDGTTFRHFAFSLDPHASDQVLQSFHPFERQIPHLIRFTDSEGSFAQMNTWLRECDTKHKVACYGGDLPPLPTRILRMKGDRVYVEEGNGRKALFATLSYCWGGREPLMLTNETYHRFATEGIQLADLPQTYRDAVKVARNLYRPVDFLWIDSLCIKQHDAEDWNRESRRMRQVYGESYVNIAAMHAANVYEGFFASVSQEPLHKFFRIPGTPLYVKEVPRETHYDFGSNYRDTREQAMPLLKRAWVLQERLLSRRTIYFDRDELLWECNVRHKCQCGAVSAMAGFKDYWAKSLSPKNPARHVRAHPVTAWMQVLTKYTSMKLTKESDRLIALEGVADAVASTNRSGEYLSGLWRNRMELQIPFILLDTYQTTASRVAPSWSWASKMGSIDFYERSGWAHYVPLSKDAAQIRTVFPFSSNKEPSGVLEVSAKAVEVTATIVQDPPVTTPAEVVITDNRSGAFVGCARGDTLDVDDRRGHQRVLTLAWWGETRNGCSTFLVLRESRFSGYHERFGIFPRVGDERQMAQAKRLAAGLKDEEKQTLYIL